MIRGESVESLLGDIGATYRRFVYDSHLRWLGPEKGVIHMAIGAVVNALWDLKAKRAGLPLWQLLSSLTPAELVGLVDFRYISDALTPDEALEIFEKALPGRGERTDICCVGVIRLTRRRRDGWDTPTRRWSGSAGRREAGFTQIKLKVGAAWPTTSAVGVGPRDVRPDIKIAIDANQRWDVPEAIQWIRALQPYGLGLGRGTDQLRRSARSPDDPRSYHPDPGGYWRARRQPRDVQAVLQLGAIDVMQIDAARVAGVNENIANLLLAAKFGIRVCPHAGGVGLCEAVQHLSMFDFVAVSQTTDDRVIEYVDHLHEHSSTRCASPTATTWRRHLPGQAPK